MYICTLTCGLVHILVLLQVYSVIGVSQYLPGIRYTDYQITLVITFSFIHQTIFFVHHFLLTAVDDFANIQPICTLNYTNLWGISKEKTLQHAFKGATNTNTNIKDSR